MWTKLPVSYSSNSLCPEAFTEKLMVLNFSVKEGVPECFPAQKNALPLRPQRLPPVSSDPRQHHRSLGETPSVSGVHFIQMSICGPCCSFRICLLKPFDDSEQQGPRGLCPNPRSMANQLLVKEQGSISGCPGGG